MLKRKIDRNGYITLQVSDITGKAIITRFTDGKAKLERPRKIFGYPSDEFIRYKGEIIYLSEFEEVKL